VSNRFRQFVRRACDGLEGSENVIDETAFNTSGGILEYFYGAAWKASTTCVVVNAMIPSTSCIAMVSDGSVQYCLHAGSSVPFPLLPENAVDRPLLYVALRIL